VRLLDFDAKTFGPLDANPVDHIKNTQSIWRTVKGGRVFDPLTLKASN
jgi:hypothetical protein